MQDHQVSKAILVYVANYFVIQRFTYPTAFVSAVAGHPLTSSTRLIKLHISVGAVAGHPLTSSARLIESRSFALWIDLSFISVRKESMKPDVLP